MRGRVWSLGNTVRKLAAVGPMMETFIETPVAVLGMVQLPLVPQTVVVKVSLLPMGVARVPTLSVGGRVSSRRHGVIGTNDETVPLPAADEVSTPPAPSTSASVAPSAT